MSELDFAVLLKRIIGLDPESVGTSAVERAVRSRMEALRLENVDGYWNRVQNSTDEFQELVELVVVPETWFFRDREAFHVLVRLIHEDHLLPNRPAPLRLLSVPCCTGEEPYSVVMALLDAGFSSAQFAMDGVDISARALARARQGTYGSNSFRGTELDFRARHFQSAGNRWVVTSEIRDSVALHHENLLSPEFRQGARPYDVIFCRNVLIYFDQETQNRVMKTLRGLLADRGILFVGPAETSLPARCGFHSVDHAMSFAFRKQIRPRTESQRLPVRQKLPLLKRSSTKSSSIAAAAPSHAKASGPVPDLKEAARLADSGKLAEAAKLCEAHLKQEGPTVNAYYLLGLVSDAASNHQRAAECYRKALYLEPNHAEALFHLALIMEREGHATEAEHLRRRARRAETQPGVDGRHSRSTS